jgi:hypothetical protein
MLITSGKKGSFITIEAKLKLRYYDIKISRYYINLNLNLKIKNKK